MHVFYYLFGCTSRLFRFHIEKVYAAVLFVTELSHVFAHQVFETY